MQVADRQQKAERPNPGLPAAPSSPASCPGHRSTGAAWAAASAAHSMPQKACQGLPRWCHTGLASLQTKQSQWAPMRPAEMHECWRPPAEPLPLKAQALPDLLLQRRRQAWLQAAAAAPSARCRQQLQSAPALLPVLLPARWARWWHCRQVPRLAPCCARLAQLMPAPTQRWLSGRQTVRNAPAAAPACWSAACVTPGGHLRWEAGVKHPPPQAHKAATSLLALARKVVTSMQPGKADSPRPPQHQVQASHLSCPLPCAQAV